MENILAAMRNNFCQNNSENEKKQKNTEVCDLRVKTKEEGLSDHLKEKVEKPECFIINPIKDEKETIQCSQSIKQEKKDSDDQEIHTDTLLVYESTNEETDLQMDIVKEEIDIKDEIDLVDDQYDSSCSSELASNFRDELCSVPKFEDADDSNLGFADTFGAPQEKVKYDNNEDEDYNHEYGDDVNTINLKNHKRRRKNKINRQTPTNVIPNSKSNPVEKDVKWCDKVRGKACFLCFDDERYQTKDSLIDHIKENHHQAKIQVYKSESEDVLDKVKKVFHIVKSITQPLLSVCIECYVVFYSAKGADMHMINHIKSHKETMPRFHEFRTCCRSNHAHCLQPLIICGEQKCRNQIHRTVSSLRIHKSIHMSPYWENNTHRIESRLIKGYRSREAYNSLRSTLSLSDSVEDSSPSAESTTYSNSKIENVILHQSKNHDISDNHNDNTIINKLVGNRNNSVDVEKTTVTNVISEMQQKFCNSADSGKTFVLKKKSRIRTGGNRKSKYKETVNDETVNSILLKMQQNFCDSLGGSVNDALDSNVNISDKDLIWKTGKMKRTYYKKKIQNRRDLSLSTSGTDLCITSELCITSKEVPDANKDVAVPEGWERQVKRRTSGISTGKFDVYYISPKGKKLQSVKEMEKYCLVEGIEVDMSQFRWSHWARNISTPKTGDRATPKKKQCSPKGYNKAKKEEVPDANEDVAVPEDWERKVKKRTSGISVGSFDVYYISPMGQKVRSVKEIEKYKENEKYCLEEGNVVNMSQFRWSRKARKKSTLQTGGVTTKKNQCLPKEYTKSKKVSDAQRMKLKKMVASKT